MVPPVTLLAALLIAEGVQQRKHRHVVHRFEEFLRRPAVDGLLEERVVHAPRGARLHALDLGDHFGIKRGLPLHLFQRGQVRKRFHPVRAKDGDLLDVIERAETSAQHADDIGPPSQHAALNAPHDGVGETA